MAVAATDITSRIANLSDSAFQAFCDDMAGMFGVDIRCERRDAAIQTAGGLRSHFKKLNVVHLVKGEGALDGTFHLLFDQGGLFILSGVVVMLPESRILEEAKRGSKKDAENLEEAAREVGNLLVGSWDRVFQDECDGHEHFLKTRTFIGKPWDDLSKIELQADTDILVGLYEMTVEPYASFKCAAIFPKAVVDGIEGDEPSQGVETLSGGVTDSEEPGDDPAVKETQAPQTKAQDAQSQPTPGPEAEPLPEPVPAEQQDDSPQSDPGAEEEITGVSTPAAPVAADAEAEVNAEAPPSDMASAKGGSAGRLLGGPGFSFLDPAYIESSPQVQDGALIELLRTPAAEIMEKDVIWAGPEDTVQDVIAKMQQRNAGYVLIGQKGLLEGLVSNSNILGAVSLYLRPMFAKWRRPQDDATLGVKVKWIMSRPVRTVRPDTTLAAMIESMRRYGGRCLPVVDEKGAVQGIVTAFDVLLRILEADRSFSWEGRPPQSPALLI